MRIRRFLFGICLIMIIIAGYPFAILAEKYDEYFNKLMSWGDYQLELL